MGNIVLLDDLTINKIAAGEVIERPASVIKEMVENSIDAGATNVTVEIKNGGISFIRITDNGKGIAKDDVEIAFERHATSKIRCAEDLTTVKSMGFRGEALASIAAISNVELASKTEDDILGTRIVVEGGKVLSLDEIACSKGTTITVRNLFFNTPVRYKFLKKDFTESGYIEDVITRIALVHPEISIKLINTGKTVIQTNGNGDIKGVIYSIFGKEVATNVLNVSYEYENIKVNGVIGKPEISRANKSNQIFFVNDRYIKNKTLSSAVEQAFKGILPIGKFAYLVLNVQIDPSKVDVNVHPAKLEVRFEDENTVFKSVYHAIKDTLSNQGISSEKEKIQEIKDNSREAFKIPSNEIQKKIEDTYKIENKEVFENLRKLQEDLRKEVSEDPSLKLTDKYKEMEEKYNDIEDEEELQENSNEDVEDSSKEKEGKIIPIKFEKSDIEEKIDVQNEIENVENTEEKENTENAENTEDVEAKEENLAEEKSYVAEEFEENTPNYENAENRENEEASLDKIELKDSVQDEENIVKEENKIEEVPYNEMYKEIFGKEPFKEKEEMPEPEEKKEEYYTLDTNMEDGNISLFETSEEHEEINFKIIGKAFENYVIIEIENELYIMNEKLAYEKTIYEDLKNKLYNSKQNGAQLLLLPDMITVSKKEMDIAKDNIKLFNKAGFMFEEFGENTIKLNGVPEVCEHLETPELFKEILIQIDKVARTASKEKEEKFAAIIANKITENININLNMEDLEGLIRELLKNEKPFIDVNGKPIVIKMSKYEIERKFSRK